MKIKRDGIVLNSGKRIYANNSIIGLSPDLSLYGGYDEFIESYEFTKDERKEISGYMIDLWKKFEIEGEE